MPNVVGNTIAEANARLAAQPLTPQYVYEPAKPRQKLGVVVRQFPARGTLSSYDKVTLVLPKALHGPSAEAWSACGWAGRRRGSSGTT